MATLRFEGKDYDTATLPEAAKRHMQSLQFLDAEVTRMNAHLALLQTARAAYVKALQESLANVPSTHPALSGETIRFE